MIVDIPGNGKLEHPLSTRRRRILVINPNSNTLVTHGIDEALEPFRFETGPEIVCVTLAEGPIGIETQAHVDSVAMPLTALIAKTDNADAFVIACYSDPGLAVCREATRKPVFGINECGVLTALSRGDRFGVIAIRRPRCGGTCATCGRWGSRQGSRASGRSTCALPRRRAARRRSIA